MDLNKIMELANNPQARQLLQSPLDAAALQEVFGKAFQQTGGTP
ncbi:MAG TPA: hypothetical protein VGJ63_09115 [Micromonosporaceae bacterium]|jgi:hypothetical protein